MPEPYPMYIPLLFAAAVNIIAAVLIYLFIKKDRFLGDDRFFTFFMALLLGVIAAVPAGIALDTYLRPQWEDSVWGYVHSTYPREKYEVVFVKIDPELAGGAKGIIAAVPEWKREVAVTVVFRDGNQLVQYTNWSVRAEVAEIQDKPLLEAMKVDEEVLGFIEPGYYDPVLYLPEDYEFH